jgi:hypothetical protein
MYKPTISNIWSIFSLKLTEAYMIIQNKIRSSAWMNRAGSYRPKLAIQKTYNLQADRDPRGLLYWEWWDTKGYGTSHLFFCRKTSSNTCCHDMTCITVSSVDNNRQWTIAGQALRLSVVANVVKYSCHWVPANWSTVKSQSSEPSWWRFFALITEITKLLRFALVLKIWSVSL